MIEVKEESTLTVNEYLTLEQAYRELKSIENQIDLFETQRKILNTPKSVNLKDVVVSGGQINNDTILNNLIKSDQYSDKLTALYMAKASYEKYIWKQIELYKDVKQGMIMHFLKHMSFRDKNTKKVKKLTWEEIAKVMNYSVKQCQRFYNEYLERNNSWSIEDGKCKK